MYYVYAKKRGKNINCIKKNFDQSFLCVATSFGWLNVKVCMFECSRRFVNIHMLVVTCVRVAIRWLGSSPSLHSVSFSIAQCLFLCVCVSMCLYNFTQLWHRACNLLCFLKYDFSIQTLDILKNVPSHGQAVHFARKCNVYWVFVIVIQLLVYFEHFNCQHTSQMQLKMSKQMCKQMRWLTKEKCVRARDRERE